MLNEKFMKKLRDKIPDKYPKGTTKPKPKITSAVASQLDEMLGSFGSPKRPGPPHDRGDKLDRTEKVTEYLRNLRVDEVPKNENVDLFNPPKRAESAATLSKGRRNIFLNSPELPGKYSNNYKPEKTKQEKVKCLSCEKSFKRETVVNNEPIENDENIEDLEKDSLSSIDIENEAQELDKLFEKKIENKKEFKGEEDNLSEKSSDSDYDGICKRYERKLKEVKEHSLKQFKKKYEEYKKKLAMNVNSEPNKNFSEKYGSEYLQVLTNSYKDQQDMLDVNTSNVEKGLDILLQQIGSIEKEKGSDYKNTDNLKELNFVLDNYKLENELPPFSNQDMKDTESKTMDGFKDVNFEVNIDNLIEEGMKPFQYLN